MTDNVVWLDFNDAPDQAPESALDAEAIRRGLLDRLEPVLFQLFPAGRIRGGKFYIGDVHGDAGESLEVVIEGEKAGLWTDRAEGTGGDLFDLIAAHAGLDARREFGAVLEAAARLLGHAPSNPARKKRREPPLDDLGPATAKWDYLDADGHLLAVVYRYDPPGRRKEFRPWDARRRKMAPPEPRPLYNQPGMAGADTVVLVEGEKCAQALVEAGQVATTAMHGARAPVAKTDWSPLAGKAVRIWPDRDKPGWEYAMAAAEAALAAGAVSAEVLLPPDDKPEGWDAADALTEGFDVAGFLAAGPRVSLQPPADEADEAGPRENDPDPSVWCSEDWLAAQFTRRYQHDWRYVALWGKWLMWDSQRWRAEETLAATDLIRQVCRYASLRVGNDKLAAKIAAAGTIGGVERLARTDRRHAATTEEWDADIWLLNTPGGVLDLRNGQARPHERLQRMTKITTATARGTSPRWLAFIDQITQGDAQYVAYLQRFAGYCLTGSTQEHALFFLYGTGANGKSVFVNTLFTILGDYAAHAPMDTFMETRGDRHPTDLAGLRGARFVGATETEQGRRWNESKIKEITGGDRVSARFMRQDFFTYVPSYKLVIAGNHKPAIRNIDEAMRRRLHLVPFTLTIPPEQRDKRLQEKLLTERDGILAWALEGCLAWQRLGRLDPPRQVMDATEEYFEAEDALGRWMDERCVRLAGARSLTAELFNDWKQWADAAGEYVGSQRHFSDRLVTRGVEKWRNGLGVRGFQGIGLKTPPAPGYGPRADG